MDNDESDDSMDVTFYVRTDSGGVLQAAGELFWESQLGEMHREHATTKAEGELDFSVSDFARSWWLLVVPMQPGFWSSYADRIGDEEEVICQPLPASYDSWWRQWGQVPGQSSDGSGIKIGVIDRACEHRNGIEHVAFLDFFGEPLPMAAPAVVLDPRIGHGEAICRILGDRGFASLAPGADISFVDARGANGGVTIADVNSAIVNLARKREVDLINISAGLALSDLPGAPHHPLAGMRQAIDEAAALGTLCFAASGNDYDDPVNAPAIFDACVAVGAVGRKDDSAPSSTAAYWWGSRATHVGPPASCGHSPFHWKPSGRGLGLNLLAPGVGLLVARGGQIAYDLVGTSFAAPVACGALAATLALDATYLALPRDKKRTEYARARLLGLCKSAGFPQTYEGAGILMAE